MKRFVVNIPASITVFVDAEDVDDITDEQVAETVGKYVELRNGEDFESDNYTIIDSWELNE